MLRSQGIPFGRWVGRAAGAAGTAVGFTLLFTLFAADDAPTWPPR